MFVIEGLDNIPGLPRGGYAIATPSCDGKISFNVISTREILPDIRFFVECLEDALAELKQAALPRKKKPARRKTTPRKAPAKKKTASRKKPVANKKASNTRGRGR